MNHKKWATLRLKALVAMTCAALMIVFCGQLFAQAGIDTGSVTGTVKDPTGAVVQKAQCTLTSISTGVTQQAVSTSAGAYAFPYVKVGTYSLKVAAAGFEESKIDGIVVHLSATVTEDVSLQVGSTTTEVTVTSAAPLLQAQDATLGMTVDSTAANELPTTGGAGGRSFLNMLSIAPGTQPSNTQLIHGAQSGALDVRVNGADDNAEVFGGQTIPPILDTIQEFKLETGNDDTSIGHSYGGVVNVVTKSGTNKFNGEAWEYNENDMYNANDYFNKRNQLLHTPSPLPNRPTRLKENSFGAIYGGPVVIPHIYNGHGKTFWMVDFQVTRYTDAPSFTGTLPTATMQNSGFKNLVDTLTLNTGTRLDGIGRTFQNGTVFDPATTRAVPCGGTDPITGLTANCAGSAVGVVTDPYFPVASLANQKVAIVRDPYFQELGQPAGCPSIVGTANWVPGTTGGPAASCLNQLPGNRLDPNAVNLLKLFQQIKNPYNNVNIDPNTGLSTTGSHSYGSNFYELTPRPVNTQQWDVRMDHTFSDKDSAFWTWSHYNQTQQQQAPFPGILEGAGSTPFWTTNPDYMVVVTETHVFNPNLINEFRMADEHNWQTRMDPGNIDNTFGSPAAYNIQGIPQTKNNGGLPVIDLGSSLSSIGSRVNVTWQKVGAWQFSDNLTKIKGKSEWKFGAEYWWTYGDIAQLPYSRGHFSYGQYSNVPASGDGGPSVTDFLINPIYNYAQGAYATNPNALSTWTNPSGSNAPPTVLGGVNGYNGNNWNKSTYHAPYIAFYAVDNWKVTPSLTFNLGIRDDYFAPYYAKDGTESEGNFWMGGAAGNVASGTAYHIAHSGCNVTTSAYFRNLMAANNIPIICEGNNAANKTPLFNWAPRLGFAYRIRPNLVIRGGAGVQYGAFDSVGYGGTLGTNYPFRVSVQQGPSFSYEPQNVSNGSSTVVPTMENTFGFVDMTNAASAYQPLGSVVLYGKPYHFKIPYFETLDFAVQYQFTGHDSIEARYVGNLGKQLESANPYQNAARQALPTSVAAVSVPSVNQQKASGCYPNCVTGATSPLMPDGTFTIPFPNLAPNMGPMENTEQVSNYESGELEYQHQFAFGFNLDANYAFTRCWSDTQAGQQNEGGPGNGRAPWVVGFGGYRADYDRCSNTSAHVFKASGEFSLPFGKGALIGGHANPIEDEIIGGWKLDPIWISASGVLSNVGCGGTLGGQKSNATGQFTGPWFQTSNTAWSCNAPLVPGKNPTAPDSTYDLARTKVTGWLNSTAFTAPTTAVTTVGQQDFTPWGARGNQVYGPGWYNFDLSTHKYFKLTESTKIEFVAEAFNVFNHLELSNPTSSGYVNTAETTTGGWGTITGDRHGPRTWEFAGKLFF